MPIAKVLIVEDEILMAVELEATLQDRGFETVGIAPDLEAALALAGSGPDIALVDVNLRDGRTGPTIADRLANEFGVTVLYLTANPDMTREASGGRVVGVLDKPFEEDTVIAALSFALGVRAGATRPPAPTGLRVFEDRPA